MDDGEINKVHAVLRTTVVRLVLLRREGEGIGGLGSLEN